MAVTGARLLYGAEGYLIEKRIRAVIEEVREDKGEEPECLFLDGEELDKSQLADMLGFVPLFAHFRVIVVRRPPWFGKPGSKEARGISAVEEVITAYLDNPNPFQVLLVTAVDVVSNNPLVKAFKKKGWAEEFRKPGVEELAEWVGEELARRGVKADASVTKFLAGSGHDMFYLENQIEKISLLYRGGRVTRAEVEELTDIQEEVSVFRFTDALLRRDQAAAHTALGKLILEGKPPVLIVYMITREFLLVGKIKGGMEQGYSPDEISNLLPPNRRFVLKKMMAAARRFNWDEMAAVFRYLLETDTALKSPGRPNERLLLEVLTARICRVSGV